MVSIVALWIKLQNKRAENTFKRMEEFYNIRERQSIIKYNNNIYTFWEISGLLYYQ